MAAQIPNNSPATGLDTVLEVLNDVVRKSGGGNYIYRGERKIYPKVSSSLYRRYEEVDSDGSGIGAVQEEILSQVKSHARHVSELVDMEILSQLQHNGGDTNLIDFTEDYLTALFFACDGEPNEPGRVILLAVEAGADYTTYRPSTPLNRVIAQKSVFVHPHKGFIEPNETIIISSALKPTILDYLRNHHGISTETIYNDIHGFIRHQDIHHAAYTELYTGVTLANRERYEESIERYSEAIKLNPQMAGAYSSRGEAYYDLKNYEAAIIDYEKALSFDPGNSAVCHNTGLAYAALDEYERAVEYYDRALESDHDGYTLYCRFEARLFLGEWDKAKQEMRFAALSGINLAGFFGDEYKSIANFQQQTGVTLPADIAGMLGG